MKAREALHPRIGAGQAGEATATGRRLWLVLFVMVYDLFMLMLAP